MKHLTILLACAALLVSCQSNDGPVAPEPTPEPAAEEAPVTFSPRASTAMTEAKRMRHYFEDVSNAFEFLGHAFFDYFFIVCHSTKI